MSGFAQRIIKWQGHSGRHDLPWQKSIDPYRVWLSEIMLQQTQVATVIPYYLRFIQRFPTLRALASADIDEVMPLWSGLGYYARARNLHATAIIIAKDFKFKFPRSADAIEALPGIGRSTAAAICVFSYGAVAAILDGNVKRVLARQFGISGDVKLTSTTQNLWAIAERELPQKNIQAYTQGLMDLGTEVCTRRKPQCTKCPVQKTCVAYQSGRVEMLPGRSIKPKLPHREIQMLLLMASGEVLLLKRPSTGIWGGLWCLPELAMSKRVLAHARQRFGIEGKCGPAPEKIEHGFSHFSLTIHPQIIQVSKRPRVAAQGVMWIELSDALDAALPAPVKKLLRHVYQTS